MTFKWELDIIVLVEGILISLTDYHETDIVRMSTFLCYCLGSVGQFYVEHFGLGMKMLQALNYRVRVQTKVSGPNQAVLVTELNDGGNLEQMPLASPPEGDVARVTQ